MKSVVDELRASNIDDAWNVICVRARIKVWDKVVKEIEESVIIQITKQIRHKLYHPTPAVTIETLRVYRA